MRDKNLNLDCDWYYPHNLKYSDLESYFSKVSLTISEKGESWYCDEVYRLFMIKKWPKLFTFGPACPGKISLTTKSKNYHMGVIASPVLLGDIMLEDDFLFSNVSSIYTIIQRMGLGHHHLLLLDYDRRIPFKLKTSAYLLTYKTKVINRLGYFKIGISNKQNSK